MFRRISTEAGKPADRVEFIWMDQALVARKGDTVAAALLGAGIQSNRQHPVTDEPRAPYCMMGTCFECLVEIDGAPNQQACQVRIKNGMHIQPQMGARR